MVRKVTLFTLVVGIGHVALPILGTVSFIAPDMAARAAVATEAQASTGSSGQFVARDTFDDNIQSPVWRVLADDANACTMKEVNQRLELQATSRAAGATAGYISSGWRLDPRSDFSVKVDYHYDLMSYAGGWVGLGVTPEVGDPWEKNAAIGVGCADGYAHYWDRHQAGLSVQSDASQRTRTNGTLYISYDADADELYLGLSGYGPDDAWTILPGLVKGEWAGRPVYIWLAGGSDGLAISSGPVYLDNLLVETGTILETSLKEVYRFWSPVLERHFYTISAAEKDMLLTQFPTVWSYEGVVYHAFATGSDPDTRPVYRFWSDKLSSHFYTLSETERDWLIAQYAHIWTFEGVAFYTYPVGRQPATARPVYRFWSPTKGSHFYTMSETERNNLVTKYSSVWMDEGIAWYADQ